MKLMHVFAVLSLIALPVAWAAQAQTLGEAAMGMEADGASAGNSAALGAAVRARAEAVMAGTATTPDTAGAVAATGAALGAAGAGAPAAPATTNGVVAGSLSEADKYRTFSGSFFLSQLEIEAINQALHGQALTQQTLSTQNQAIPQKRVIRLSGVLYRAPEDWIVWMNNRKVTPDNLLPEIVDISVRDSSKVHLKWYDVGLNQVISITLRPHQVYDIVSGVLLPGSD